MAPPRFRLATEGVAADMNEIVFDVRWDGPFTWDDSRNHTRDDHVLYALYGTHPLYGRDVLLYIGQSRAGVRNRLNKHAAWVGDEADEVTVRLGSIGLFRSWTKWSADAPYETAGKPTVDGIEALLIAAHQPGYNSQNKAQIRKAKGIRLFNTGRSGSLLPEVSYGYWIGAAV